MKFLAVVIFGLCILPSSGQAQKVTGDGQVRLSDPAPPQAIKDAPVADKPAPSRESTHGSEKSVEVDEATRKKQKEQADSQLDKRFEGSLMDTAVDITRPRVNSRPNGNPAPKITGGRYAANAVKCSTKDRPQLQNRPWGVYFA